MLTHACDRGIGAAFVAGDEVYGGRDLRRTVRGLDMGYVMAVKHNHTVTLGPYTTTARKAVRLIGDGGWQRMRTGTGTKGVRSYDWAMLAITPDDTPDDSQAGDQAGCQERLAAGDAWNDTGFVFTQENGDPLHPTFVSGQFLVLAMWAGLPPVRLHDLRHGAATILLRAGHDLKVVQETLGLSSISIASDTCTSVLPDLARQSAEDAATVLLNARTQPDEPPPGRIVHLPEASSR